MDRGAVPPDPATVLNIPPSFRLDLYPSGFVLRKPPAVNAALQTGSTAAAQAQRDGMLHPYDRSTRPFLQAVDDGRVPDDLLGWADCTYHDGHLVAEIQDLRHASKPGSISAPDARRPPRIYRIMLRPTQSTLFADAEELAAASPAGPSGRDNVSYERRLRAEAMVLYASQRALSLDPSPATFARLTAQRYQQRNMVHGLWHWGRRVAAFPALPLPLPASGGKLGKAVTKSQRAAAAKATSAHAAAPGGKPLTAKQLAAHQKKEAAAAARTMLPGAAWAEAATNGHPAVVGRRSGKMSARGDVLPGAAAEAAEALAPALSGPVKVEGGLTPATSWQQQPQATAPAQQQLLEEQLMQQRVALGPRPYNPEKPGEQFALVGGDEQSQRSLLNATMRQQQMARPRAQPVAVPPPGAPQTFQTFPDPPLQTPAQIAQSVATFPEPRCGRSLRFETQARAAYTPLMKHPPPHLAAQQAGHVRLASGLPRVRLVGQGGVNLSKSERNHTFLTEAQVVISMEGALPSPRFAGTLPLHMSAHNQAPDMVIHLPPLGTAEEVASFVKTFKELAKLEGNTLAQEKLLGLPNRPSLFGIPASTPLVSKSHPGAQPISNPSAQTYPGATAAGVPVPQGATGTPPPNYLGFLLEQEPSASLSVGRTVANTLVVTAHAQQQQQPAHVLGQAP